MLSWTMIKFYTHIIIPFFILKMRTLKQHNYEPVISQIDQLTILIHKKHRIFKSLIETLSKLKFEYDTYWKIKMMKSIEYGPNIKHKSYISWLQHPNRNQISNCPSTNRALIFNIYQHHNKFTCTWSCFISQKSNTKN